MALNVLLKPLGFTAASLAIVQGLAWTILSLLEFFLRFEVWTIEGLTNPANTHKDRLRNSILNGYVLGDEGFTNIPGLFIRPQMFFGWGIIYLIVSVFWIALSVNLLVVLISNRTSNIKKSFLTWGMWTIVVCVLDFILTIFLGLDYGELVSNYNKNLIPDNYPVLACAVLMTLAARGFVLWLVNFVFGIIMLVIFSKLPKKFEQLESNYSTHSLAFLRNPGERGAGRKNNPDISFGTFQGLPRLAPVQSTNTRLTSRMEDIRRSIRGSEYQRNSNQENPQYFRPSY